MIKLFIFIVLLIVLDNVTGIFVNCFIKKKKFESAKIKKGLIEKGIELLIIGTIYLGKDTTLAPVIVESHLDTLTISLFALQECVSIFENYKKIK